MHSLVLFSFGLLASLSRRRTQLYVHQRTVVSVLFPLCFPLRSVSHWISAYPTQTELPVWPQVPFWLRGNFCWSSFRAEMYASDPTVTAWLEANSSLVELGAHRKRCLAYTRANLFIWACGSKDRNLRPHCKDFPRNSVVLQWRCTHVTHLCTSALFTIL